MRILAASLAACALVAAGGCLGDGGTVMISFDQQMAVTPTITGFNASNATANEASDGFVHFTATSSQFTLTMLIVPPIHAGDMVDMGNEHNFISFDIPGVAGWANNGGMLAVDGVAPYRLRFLAIPMLRGSGSAMGSFVVDGSGTFK
ncbi:MAG: hypothetical protein JWM53_2244 [bacterium]|nr:hypothetical protein [bacterium]